MTAEQLAFAMPVAGLMPVDPDWANVLLARWQHRLGPINRPFGCEAWTLDIDGLGPVAVAVSVSTVSEHVSGTEDGQRIQLPRGELVELGRLCADPDQRWATRPMLRLWREVAARRWPYWALTAAVSYSHNRTTGDLYRWDGWTKIADNCGSSGGGAWSRKRYATDAVHGRKSLWLWRYGATAAPEESP